MSNHSELEKRLWSAADELRANSGLRSAEFATPVLGLIFLRQAEYLCAQHGAAGRARPRMELPEQAHFARLRGLPAEADAGRAINDAMRAIEASNAGLRDALPKTYDQLDRPTLAALLDMFAAIPLSEIAGDTFGAIYEYFLGKFALAEGQKGGEFFTPAAIVELLVTIIEPYSGRIFDPACGSGGMFVQCARFVESQRRSLSAISVYGQEKVAETIRLCRMNLAVHGLSGDIRAGNAYYEDVHRSVGAFDFVLANPPFNVDRVDKARVKGDPRYSLGVPKAGSANYLWIQIFSSALNATGRAGFVMANSASDARGAELAIRRKLIESGSVDVVIAIAPSFFYTVTLPCMLWFLDKGKVGTPRANRLLFIDARSIYRQIDRAHRDFSAEQVQLIAAIVRAYRALPTGMQPRRVDDHDRMALLDSTTLFSNGRYYDVGGLCNAATLAEVAAQGWSLNPSRYVGAATRPADDDDFAGRLAALRQQLATLNDQARVIERRIDAQMTQVLAGEADA
jgi:type I restriction enzyme M protein